MLPPHIIVVEEVLPEVRRKMARALYSEGMSQENIAQIIGTSQAMISRYLSLDREPIEDILSVVERVSRELVVAVLAGAGPEEITERFCITMETIISEGHLDKRYISRFGRAPCRSCMGPTSDGGGSFSMLEDLNTAVRFLRSHPIPDLIPALKVNIAYGSEGGKEIQDVASFPGRLPDRGGMVQEPVPPEFGVSKHLASALLSAMMGDSGKRAVISLAHGEKLEKALKMNGKSFLLLDRSKEGLHDLLERSGPNDMTFVVDPGDFGIEPCLYIFGGSPLEVVSLAVEVQKRISDINE